VPRRPLENRKPNADIRAPLSYNVAAPSIQVYLAEEDLDAPRFKNDHPRLADSQS